MNELGGAARQLRDRLAAVNENARDPRIPDIVCSACADLLDMRGVVVSVMTSPQSHHRLCANDDALARLFDLEFSLGEGPCTESFHVGGPVLVPDLTVPDPRWPVFLSELGAPGMRALFVFPMQVGSVRVGILALSRDRAGELTGDELAECLMMADSVTQVVLDFLQADVTTMDGRLSFPGGVEQTEVHEAIGMVMGQLGGDATSALNRLRAEAFVQNRTLSAIAHDVRARTLRFDQDPQR